MRHHLDPQRTRPPVSIAPGPAPTRADDADPTYEPPRVLGFTGSIVYQRRWRTRPTGETVPLPPRVLSLEVDRMPLLWDGDQV